MHIYKCKRFNY